MTSSAKTNDRTIAGQPAISEAERLHQATIENLRSHIKRLKFKVRIADRTVMAAGRLLQGSWPVQP
jgi:hypothetical protein